MPKRPSYASPYASVEPENDPSAMHAYFDEIPFPPSKKPRTSLEHYASRVSTSSPDIVVLSARKVIHPSPSFSSNSKPPQPLRSVPSSILPLPKTLPSSPFQQAALAPPSFKQPVLSSKQSSRPAPVLYLPGVLALSQNALTSIPSKTIRAYLKNLELVINESVKAERKQHRVLAKKQRNKEKRERKKREKVEEEMGNESDDSRSKREDLATRMREFSKSAREKVVENITAIPTTKEKPRRRFKTLMNVDLNTLITLFGLRYKPTKDEYAIPIEKFEEALGGIIKINEMVILSPNIKLRLPSHPKSIEQGALQPVDIQFSATYGNYLLY